jgi:glyoxylate reductase
VTRQIADAALERLRAAATVTVWPGATPPPASALHAALADADAVLSMVTDRIDARLS